MGLDRTYCGIDPGYKTVALPSSVEIGAKSMIYLHLQKVD